MDKTTFKKLLSFLESSGGKNTNHPETESGIHEGTKAIGEYGLMPITAQEMAGQRIKKGIGTPLDSVVDGADPTQVEEILQDNPDKYNQYVDQMADKVMKKSQGNDQEAAMRWLAGPNSSPERLRSIASEVPQRVERMNEFMNQNPGQSQDESYVQKILADQPVKENLFNKIRTRIGSN